MRLAPRAGRDELGGVRDGVLAARVAAAPVDGAANAALCRLIAHAAGVPPSHVRILRGERSREKLVAVEGLDDAALLARVS